MSKVARAPGQRLAPLRVPSSPKKTSQNIQRFHNVDPKKKGGWDRGRALLASTSRHASVALKNIPENTAIEMDVDPETTYWMGERASGQRLAPLQVLSSSR